MPHADLGGALGEYGRKRNTSGDIYWTSWRYLPSLLQKALESESTPCFRAVVEDMLKLLVRKGLTMFLGVEPTVHEFAPSSFEFYRRRLRTSYQWPDICAKDEMRWKYT